MPSESPSDAKPPPPPLSTPLAQRINSATRRAHIESNALILSLLPLALKPHVADPCLYVRGMRCIYEIYFAFEHITRTVLHDPSPPQQYDCRTVAAVRRLHIPALERRWRLARDIDQLTNPRGEEKGLIVTRAQLSQRQPRLVGFLSHVYSRLPRRPHLLLAYHFLFYHALFNGGRHIRAQLKAAGCRFWHHPDAKEHAGSSRCDEFENKLSFWHFDSEEDGEDLKAEFRRRYEEVEAAFTEEEKEEIVEEARYVMAELLGVVQEMGEVIGLGKATFGSSNSTSDSTPPHATWLMRPRPRMANGLEVSSLRWLLLKHVFPMGTVELALAMWDTAVCALGVR
ncbi:MAG: hypothetical protein Q9217_006194 [Psora testacea]